jgi:hypothetical protein
VDLGQQASIPTYLLDTGARLLQRKEMKKRYSQLCRHIIVPPSNSDQLLSDRASDSLDKLHKIEAPLNFQEESYDFRHPARNQLPFYHNPFIDYYSVASLE